MEKMIKYPSTSHLEGSRLQPGDKEDGHIPVKHLAGRWIVVEEKMDGANSGISFSDNFDLMLQSRGHFLTGGYGERHFNLLKTWAHAHDADFLDVLEDRYLMYGEWMYAKHSIFYDYLPHYFLEFDIWDRSRQIMLSTSARRSLLAHLPVVSVPVLYEGPAPNKIEELLDLIRPSLGQSPQWRNRLAKEVSKHDLDWERTLLQTRNSDFAEGLYIKVEEDDRVVDRFKWVCADFQQTIMTANEEGDHWQRRPIIPNGLAPGVDLFSGEKSKWIFHPDVDSERRWTKESGYCSKRARDLQNPISSFK